MNPFEDLDLTGITDEDIKSYFDDMGIDYKTPSNPKVTADVTAARDKAKAEGNSKTENVLNKVLLYGDKVLTILTKNGILGTNALANYSSATGTTTTTTDTTDTSNAPDASNRVFNIDFTNPTTLIIVFGGLLMLFYFLFFNSKKAKNAKR